MCCCMLLLLLLPLFEMCLRLRRGVVSCYLHWHIVCCRACRDAPNMSPDLFCFSRSCMFRSCKSVGCASLHIAFLALLFCMTCVCVSARTSHDSVSFAYAHTRISQTPRWMHGHATTHDDNVWCGINAHQCQQQQQQQQQHSQPTRNDAFASK